MEETGIMACFLVIYLVLMSAAISSAGGVKTTRRPMKEEKMSNIKVYWHDIIGGSNQSSVCIIPPIKKAKMSGFGAVNIIDNPLTAGPDVGSKLVGRAQGLYAEASQQELSFLMAMNFVFTSGEYNQSSLTLVGRNTVFHPTRELPVIGGSGHFKFARGSAILKTVKMDAVVATVLYDIHVLHY